MPQTLWRKVRHPAAGTRAAADWYPRVLDPRSASQSSGRCSTPCATKSCNWTRFGTPTRAQTPSATRLHLSSATRSTCSGNHRWQCRLRLLCRSVTLPPRAHDAGSRSLVQEHAAKFRPAGAARTGGAKLAAGSDPRSGAPAPVRSSSAGDAAAGRPLNMNAPTTPPTAARRRTTRPVHTPASSLRRSAAPGVPEAASGSGSGGATVQRGGASLRGPGSPGALAASSAHVAGLTSFQALSAFLCSAHDPRLASSGAALRGLGLTASMAPPHPGTTGFAGLSHPLPAVVAPAAAPAPATMSTSNTGSGSYSMRQRQHSIGRRSTGHGNAASLHVPAGGSAGASSKRLKWRVGHGLDVVDLPQ